jgi:predicted Zn finger-like uncharacterized protein
MKFVCDSCNTKYTIADERVHGRVLKIRCKTCDHVITVREEMKPREPAPSNIQALANNLDGEEHTVVSSMSAMMPGPAAAEPPADEWYVSFDGEQEGPLSLSRALDRVRAERPKGKEAHAWRPGFFVWLSVEDVPEFAPALVKAKPVLPSKPALKSPSSSMPAVKTPEAKIEPPKLDPLPPIDSKPMALPPPPGPISNDTPLNLPLPLIPPLPAPDSIPSSPMAVQVTKPEPRLTRKALEEAAPKEDRKPEPPATPEVSAFAAALAATKGQEPKLPDTGPVPLPPPPGSDNDLAISEPSGILSLSSLPQPLARPTDKGMIDTFGGVAVTPAGTNGTASAAPVVVVAGPAQSAAAWVKYTIAFLLLLVVGLFSMVVYQWTRTPVPEKAQPVAEPSRPVDDKPIQVADPAPPTSIGLPSDPKKPAPQPAAPKPHKVTATAPSSPKLSNEQKNLAAIYGDTKDEKGTPKDTSVSEHSLKAQATQVSESSIRAVVTQNRRALNSCYERVLKHDTSLKRARVETHVKIGISGAVLNVSVPDPEYADSEIAQCLVQTIKHWHFPSADAEYETQFPIILQAE